jgi:hypothetical protein
MADALTIILSIAIPMISGFAWIIYLLMEKRRDISSLSLRLSEKISDSEKTISYKISHIEGKIFKIEGYLEGYGVKHVCSHK